MCFFFYGTLRDAEVRRRVLSPHQTSIVLEAAILPGWRCVYARGRAYPVVVPARAGTVEGLLARGVSAPAARRLVAFESDEYRMQRSTVRTADGAPVSALIFVARSHAVATGRSWTFDQWRRRHRAAFLAGFREWVG